MLYVAEVVLHCNRHIGASERRTADTTCALSGSIFGAGKSIEIRFRMCGPPLFQIYMDSLRGSSDKIGTIQRRLAWPLRKDDTHKSRSVLPLH